jgi:hypothetical protein
MEKVLDRRFKKGVLFFSVATFLDPRYSILHINWDSNISVQNHLVAGHKNLSFCFWKKAEG